MVFSSLSFIFLFLSVTVILYYISDVKYKNIVLVIASLVFYSFGEPIFVYLLFISIVLNYFFALAIDAGKAQETKKLFLFMAIGINVAI